MSSIHVVALTVANSFSFCTVFNVTIPQFIIHAVVHGHLVCFFGSYEYSYICLLMLVCLIYTQE